MCLSQHLRPDRQRPACLSNAMLLWLAGGADGNGKPEDQHCRRQPTARAVGLSHGRVLRSVTQSARSARAPRKVRQDAAKLARPAQNVELWCKHFGAKCTFGEKCTFVPKNASFENARFQNMCQMLFVLDCSENGNNRDVFTMFLVELFKITIDLVEGKFRYIQNN